MLYDIRELIAAKRKADYLRRFQQDDVSISLIYAFYFTLTLSSLYCLQNGRQLLFLSPPSLPRAPSRRHLLSAVSQRLHFSRLDFFSVPRAMHRRRFISASLLPI